MWHAATRGVVFAVVCAVCVFMGLPRNVNLLAVCAFFPLSLSLSVGVFLWLSRCLRVESNDDIINASLTEASGKWQVATATSNVDINTDVVAALQDKSAD